MCRLAGRHLEAIVCAPRIPVNMSALPHACRFRPPKGTLLGKTEDGCASGTPRLLAGVTAYCSILTIRYDISCGGLSPEFGPTRYRVRTAAGACRAEGR